MYSRWRVLLLYSYASKTVLPHVALFGVTNSLSWHFCYTTDYRIGKNVLLWNIVQLVPQWNNFSPKFGQFTPLNMWCAPQVLTIQGWQSGCIVYCYFIIVSSLITLISLVHLRTPHFCIVKLGFAEVYIIYSSECLMFSFEILFWM